MKKHVFSYNLITELYFNATLKSNHNTERQLKRCITESDSDLMQSTTLNFHQEVHKSFFFFFEIDLCPWWGDWMGPLACIVCRPVHSRPPRPTACRPRWWSWGPRSVPAAAHRAQCSAGKADAPSRPESLTGDGEAKNNLYNNITPSTTFHIGCIRVDTAHLVSIK